jgi:hypothetical protein
MPTYEELKQKVKENGYMSLKGEERKAYSAFKKEDEAVESVTKASVKAPAPPTKVETATEKKVKPKGKTITITEEELEERMQKAIENSKRQQPRIPTKQNKWEEVEPGKEKHRTARLKLYQKDGESPYGVVTRVDTFKQNAWNEETHKHDKLIYKIDVLYDDGKTETIEIDAESYTQLSQTEEVELIAVDRKKMRKVSGKTGIPIRDKEGYPIMKVDGRGYGIAQGIVGEVELEDIMYDETFTVQRQNGQTFKIHANYLNN